VKLLIRNRDVKDLYMNVVDENVCSDRC